MTKPATTALIRRLAGLLVVVYVLCVLAPAAALAGADAAGAAHCLTGGAAVASAPQTDHGHSHHDAAPHDAAQMHHDAGDNGKNNVAGSNCCMFMCVPALAASFSVMLGEPPLGPEAVPHARPALMASEPALLHRPPIASPSL